MIEINASEGEQEEVLSWLREFNFEKNGSFMNSLVNGEEKEFFLVSKNDEGEVTGGLCGTLLHRWLKVDIMAVRPNCRGAGLGRELMKEAEARAKEEGCSHAYVDTMSYQAPGFYEKLGYQECGRLRNWDSHGHDKVFLTKALS